MVITNQNNWQQVTEVALIYKNKIKPSLRPHANSSSKAYKILIDSWDENLIEYVEAFKVLLLSRANRVLGVYQLSIGGTTGTLVDPKLVFTAALKANACSIILAHNHPSGALKPSHQDKEITKKLIGAGKFLDIMVLDHLIITTEGYYSFADSGDL